MKFLGFEESRILMVSGTIEPEYLIVQKDKLKEASSLGKWLAE